MKVLLAHCYYRSSAPSGEDAVFESESRLLERLGIEVIPFIRRNDDLADDGVRDRLAIAVRTTWSRSSMRELSSLIRRARPDIAHFHNTFPQISPSGYSACRINRVPVVQTLHNYRLICAGALLQREGRPCEDCVGRSLLPGLIHRCYRDSLLATGALTLMLAVNRAVGSYRDNVDRYIALTDFAASRFVAGGLPPERIVVKPNCLVDAPLIGFGQGGYFAYVGRLSAEKGVLSLIEAWRELRDIPLKVIGDGPLGPRMREIAAREALDVEFLGFLGRSEVLQCIGDATGLIVPSECYEGFPMVVLEAYACGTPVLASGIGSLDEIVLEGETGFKFGAGDPASIRAAVRGLLADRDGTAAMRLAARRRFEERYTADQNARLLLSIYESLLRGRGGHGAAKE